MLADSFSDVFWPTLWATLIAVVVGIPVGLYLDRRRRAAESQAGELAQRQEDDLALAVARASVENARTALHELQGDLAKPNFVPTGTGLMTGDWEAVRAAVLRALRDDAELRGTMGRFFGQLDHLVVLNERLVYFAIGAGSTHSDAGQMFAQIREMESGNVTELIPEATEIVERLDRRTSTT
ncbi:MAG: hypothetical protein M3P18_16030 [Actinomycetota bacterium]|nr:hypothetical protein [Actinomycetota bacterium]